MRDPDDGTTEGPTETLQAGPSRPPLFQPIPARWRQRATAPVAFALGVAVAVAALLSGQDQPTPTPPRADEHDVELILFETVPPSSAVGGRASETRPLLVKAALLLSGAVTSTVSRIEVSDGSLDVRAPGLPLTVSSTDRFQPVNLRISVRDCEGATQWAPADRPFAITWRDEFDRMHTDRAGDFGTSTTDAMLRYIAAACGDG